MIWKENGLSATPPIVRRGPRITWTSKHQTHAYAGQNIGRRPPSRWEHVKQWLKEGHVAESVRNSTRIHKFRWNSIDTWIVPAITGFLRLAVHLLLCLFFSWLVLFSWDLDLVVGAASPSRIDISLVRRRRVCKDMFADCI